MREIKVRAWHEDWEVMVYSTSNHDWFEKREFYPIKMDIGFSSYPKDDGWVLMQYTGLKDKNGKEIYEGDIVGISWWDGLEDKTTQAQVIFKSGSFMWDDKKRYDSLFYKHMTFDVIGNIYENPELLNVKAEGKL